MDEIRVLEWRRAGLLYTNQFARETGGLRGTLAGKIRSDEALSGEEQAELMQRLFAIAKNWDKGMVLLLVNINQEHLPLIDMGRMDLFDLDLKLPLDHMPNGTDWRMLVYPRDSTLGDGPLEQAWTENEIDECESFHLGGAEGVR